MTAPSIRDYCIEKKYIDNDYHQVDFVCFDIETLTEDRDIVLTDKLFMHSSQKVVTVAVSKSWGRSDSRTKVLKRRSFSQDHYETFVNEFLSHLNELQSELVDLMPRKILHSISHLEQEANAIKNQERNYSPEQATQLRDALHYLKSMTILRVYGYNSGHFDLPVLFQGEFVIVSW